MDSIIPKLPKSGISSLKPSSVVVQPCLCLTWSETLGLKGMITSFSKSIIYCRNEKYKYQIQKFFSIIFFKMDVIKYHQQTF